jgi:hypothetical protein
MNKRAAAPENESDNPQDIDVTSQTSTSAATDNLKYTIDVK